MHLEPCRFLFCWCYCCLCTCIYQNHFGHCDGHKNNIHLAHLFISWHMCVYMRRIVFAIRCLFCIVGPVAFIHFARFFLFLSSFIQMPMQVPYECIYMHILHMVTERSNGSRDDAERLCVCVTNLNFYYPNVSNFTLPYKFQPRNFGL